MGWATVEDRYGQCDCPSEELVFRARTWLYLGLFSAWLGEDLDIDQLLELRFGTSHENKAISCGGLYERADPIGSRLKTPGRTTIQANIPKARISGLAVQRMVVSSRRNPRKLLGQS